MRGSLSLALTAPASAAFALRQQHVRRRRDDDVPDHRERRPRDLSCAAEPAS
ncbi:hypothetical protein AB0K64_20650 [Streptomyces sp. NPDC053741]|uniref:hypothetical protein n=1 Tax=Streptomyces TaxID=1883 RepID=UPI0002E2A25E|nr:MULTISPECIES: hypothetical protein [Streptomyces]MDF6060908.1 hypothetical protein [Streptomyces sp. JH010]MDX2619927.1 hypothetical protein [Streptomyces sp. WI03-5b]MEE1781190.1 hypothetical protein [Streptomyces sp. JV181]MYT54579.1 hypothetical protein [Streptomyces sp. SID7815]MYT58618.1 hypothetical protein [Streptomyces sp. SID7834]